MGLHLGGHGHVANIDNHGADAVFNDYLFDPSIRCGWKCIVTITAYSSNHGICTDIDVQCWNTDDRNGDEPGLASLGNPVA